MGFEDVIQLVNQVVTERKGRPLKTVERIVLQGAWENATYTHIAATTVGYTEDYLKKDVGPSLWKLLTEVVGGNKIKVTKRNLQNVLQDWAVQQERLSPPASQAVTPQGADQNSLTAAPTPAEWVLPSIDVSTFFGREADLAALHQLIMVEQCRLVMLWGLPGCGKTFLAAAIAQQLEQQFDLCCYIPLSRNIAPEALRDSLLRELGIAATPNPWAAVLQKLAEQRCLVILDGGEHLLAPQQLAGTFRSGFTATSELLRQIAEYQHRSCLLWVAPEKPRSISPLEGGRVRSHRLEGFSSQEAQQFLSQRGHLAGDAIAWQQLVDRYSGSPQLLKGLASMVLNVYRGDLQRFLADSPPLETATHLSDYLARLTESELLLLAWLSLAQEPISLVQLQQDMLTSPSTEIVQSLLARGLAQIGENPEAPLCLQVTPCIRSLVLDQLFQTLVNELEAERFGLLQQLPLLWTTASERVQVLQQRSLLQPLADYLRQQYSETSALREKISRLHQSGRSQLLNQPGYGAGNLIHLYQQLDLGLGGMDFSQLAIWHANLRQGGIQGANFSQAQFRHTLFATALGREPVVAFSHDGELMAIGDRDGRLLLWEVASGRLSRVLMEDGPVPIKALAFSADREWLAVGGENGGLYLWSLHRPYAPEELRGHQQAVVSLAFSPDGTWLAAGEAAGSLRIWDLASGTCLRHLTRHAGAVYDLQVAGDRLISCGDDQLACLWQPLQGKLMAAYQGSAETRLYAVGFDGLAPEGTALAVGYADQCLVIWDVYTSRPCWILPTPLTMLLAMALSPNGEYLACSQTDGKVTVWDIHGRHPSFSREDFTAPVWALTFSPDSQLLATASDYSVRLWDIGQGDCLRSLHSPRYPVSALCFIENGAQLITGHEDAQVRIWQLHPQPSQPPLSVSHVPQRLHSLRGHSHSIRTIAASPDGSLIASSDGDSIRLWGRTSGTCLRSIHQVDAKAIALSPDGQWLVSGSEDGSLLAWQLNQNSAPAELLGHQSSILALAITADGAYVASSSRDRSLRLWQLATGQEIQSLEGYGHIQTLSLSPDGTHLLGASNDGSVYWWQLPELVPAGTWRHPDSLMVCEVLYDVDGQPLAIVSDACTLTAWSVMENQPLADFKGHHQEIWQVCSSPDGQRLASASLGEEIRIWQTATGSCEQVLRPDRPYEGVNLNGAQGVTAPERLMLKSLGAAIA